MTLILFYEKIKTAITLNYMLYNGRIIQRELIGLLLYSTWGRRSIIEEYTVPRVEDL